MKHSPAWVKALSLVTLFVSSCADDPPNSAPTSDSGPILVSPVNGAFVGSVSVQMTWRGSMGINEYQCQVSQTSNFAEVDFDSTVSDTTVAALFSSRFVNHWRVRAKIPTGVYGPWSDVAKFSRWVFVSPGGYTEEGNSICQANDGGFVIAGSIYSSDSTTRDVYLVKINPNGNMVWARTFGGRDVENASCVQQTTDGGFIVCGGGYSAGIQYVSLIKTDGSGNQQWVQAYDGGTGYSVKQTSDGGFVIAGSASFDALLIKTDLNGIIEWTQTYGGNRYEVARSVLQTSDGGFAFAGVWAGSDSSDVCLVRTDGDGDSLWMKTYGGSGRDEGYCIIQTEDNGFAVIGETGSPPSSIISIYLIKTDQQGNESWSRMFGQSGGFNRGTSVLQTEDGGFVLTGFVTVFNPSLVSSDFAFIKTDANGNLQWSKAYGGLGYDHGNGVLETSDGGYILTGTSQSYQSILVIKTDAQGEVGN